jgi:hypothetical protein
MGLRLEPSDTERAAVLNRSDAVTMQRANLPCIMRGHPFIRIKG